MPSIIGWIKNGRKGKNLAYMPASYPSDRVAYGDGTVKDALDGLTADDIGNGTNIKSYTSSNMYTVPSDGYICLTSSSSSVQAGLIRATICGNDGAYSVDLTCTHPRDTGLSSANSCLVKKGMKVYITNSADPNATNTAQFFPLS